MEKPPYTDAENESNAYFQRLAADKGTVWEQDDYETDQILNKEAVRVVRDEPVQVARKSFVGLFTFWYQLTSLPNSLLALACTIGAWALAIVGWRRARREGNIVWPLLLPVFYLNIVLALAARARPVFGADPSGPARGVGVRRRQRSSNDGGPAMPEVTIRVDEIRAIVLDVDGTLYQQGPVRRAMMGRLARAHWCRPTSGLSTTRILAAYRRAQESLRSSAFEGDLGTAQIDLAAEQSGADAATVQACVDHWMETAPLDLVAAERSRGPRRRARLDGGARSQARGGVGLPGPTQVASARYRRPVRQRRVGAGRAGPGVQTEPAGHPGGVGRPRSRPRRGACTSATVQDVDAPAAAAADVRCVLIGASRRSYRRRNTIG